MRIYLTILVFGLALVFANTESSAKTPDWQVSQCLAALEKLSKEIPPNAYESKINVAEALEKVSLMLELEQKKPDSPLLQAFQSSCSLYQKLIQTQASNQAILDSILQLFEEKNKQIQALIQMKEAIENFYLEKSSNIARDLEEEKERAAMTSEELKQKAKQREDSLKAEAQAREAALKKALDEERKKAEERQKEAKNKLNELQSKLIMVTQDARGIILSMSDILFDVNKATLKADLKTSLAKVAGILSVYQEFHVIVEGHTDNTGSKEHNLKLSEQRAKGVLDFLVEQGIDSKRLTSKGLGMSMPIADNKTKEGRQKNRRVDLVIKDKSLKNE
jgi:outer membrane protein OmpA-like peptidoglycan-associated protein